MKLQDQVTSLELARKLKKLGVKQESLFWWAKRPDEIPSSALLLNQDELKEQLNSINFRENFNIYSAFTVAELGEMLPNEIGGYKTHKEGLNWCSIKYVSGEHSKYDWLVWADTEANARAKMLIYLLENGLIKL